MDTPWQDREWLQNALDERGGFSNDPHYKTGAATKLANDLGCSQSVITKWIAKLGIESCKPPEPIPPLVPRENVFIELAGDALILSDLHIPTVRYDVVDWAIDDAVAAGITTCIIPGDLFSADALASHERKQPAAGTDAELEHGPVVMDRVLRNFQRVIVTRGNHDRHHARAWKLGEQFDKALRMLLADVDPKLLRRMQVSNKDKCYLDTDKGRYLVAHTYSYSRIAMSYPMKLAVRYNMNVVGAHRHHYGVCIAPNGKYAVESGGAFDTERMAYLHDWTNDLPEMVNGYVLIRNGRPILPMI